MELLSCVLKDSNKGNNQKKSEPSQEILYEYRLHTYDCDNNGRIQT